MNYYTQSTPYSHSTCNYVIKDHELFYKGTSDQETINYYFCIMTQSLQQSCSKIN